MFIVQKLRSSESFDHYLKSDGTIFSVEIKKDLPFPQSLNKAIRMVKEASNGKV